MDLMGAVAVASLPTRCLAQYDYTNLFDKAR
jgi:hypothetical protein